MVDLITLVTICKEALAGRNKVVNIFRKRRLTEEEKELLVATYKGKGKFYFCSIDAIPGGWIRAGSKEFLDNKDYAYNAKYLEAFRFLCERGYVEHKSGKLFMLTSSGYKRAMKLAKTGVQ